MTPFLWERFAPDGRLSEEYQRAAGALQSLRRGANAVPGGAPEMWRYYTQFSADGRLSLRLRSEHICLVTYGFHQQGASFSVHQPGIQFGRALNELRRSGSHSDDAIDSRVLQVAAVTQSNEIMQHLRSIVGLMRATKKPIGFDYTLLFRDLVALQQEAQAGRVRRRWGSAYYAPDTQSETTQE